jgi:surface antigen
MNVAPWLVAASMSAMTTVALAQGMTGFLKNSPIAYFKEQDFQMMKQAAETVLNSEDPNASETWKNSATGNSGEIKTLKSYNAPDGRPCKQLRVDNRARAVQGASAPKICRTADGIWKFDVDALK